MRYSKDSWSTLHHQESVHDLITTIQHGIEFTVTEAAYRIHHCNASGSLGIRAGHVDVESLVEHDLRTGYQVSSVFAWTFTQEGYLQQAEGISIMAK